MAVLALATDLADLRARLGRMIACFSRSGEPLTADDFGITGALCVLLMDALMPTTMQVSLTLMPNPNPNPTPKPNPNPNPNPNA